MSGEDAPRPAKRFDVALFIGDADTEGPLGLTHNLSLSGIYVVTQQRPDIGSIRRISFVWGDEDFGCQAKVVRHADDGIALTFLEPDELFIGALKEILEDQESVEFAT